MYDVVTFGSAVVDTFLETELAEKHHEFEFPVGCKIVVRKAWHATGGGGTNTAVAFSRLGMKTAFLGKLGRDTNAKLILEELKANRIGFIGKQGDEPTGMSVIIDSKRHNRTIFTYKGANESVAKGDVNLRKLKTKWLYFSAAVGKALKTQAWIARWAKARGIRLAYNPSSYITQNPSKEVFEILRNTEVLILNDEEASQLTKRTGKDVFRVLHSLGPKVVCVTSGPKGNAVCDGQMVCLTSSRKVKLVERTGAGDAFAAGFVVGMERFNDVLEASKLGTLNAESVIQKPGAKNGLLSWREAKGLMKRTRFKTKVERLC
ncbi:carbohydrate kinase family protein [Candidatus Pacearchaeota archaeon]|nr:MAG: carbohydrate kinase family protein [Candidatus Pacearchaeota archaeon]